VTQNKRKLGNNRIRLFFIAYLIFSVLPLVLFLDWELFLKIFLNRFPGIENTFRSFHGVSMIILLFLWGIFSFLLAYTYLDAKFMGIFERLNTFFKNMLKDSSLKLEFRQGDPFSEMANAFNNMKQVFLERIVKRTALIKQITSTIESLPSNSPELSQQKWQDLIQKIDQELESVTK